MEAPEVMLASPSSGPRLEAVTKLTDTGRWTAEIKYDGIRAVATLDGDSVHLHSRSGIVITKRYPEVVAALAGMGVRAQLDGELIVYGATGLPAFELVHKREMQWGERAIASLARTTPATFVAFDLLSLNGMDLRGLTYQRRRARLEQLSETLTLTPATTDGQSLWELVVKQGLEGAVVKRLESRYQAGRSADWVKVKNVKRVSALVSGFDPGKGSLDGTFGALHLALLDTGRRLIPIGSVGTGFTAADRRELWLRMHRPDLQPLIVDVEYLGVSTDGKLREPSFKGLRLDIVLTDCTLDQLDAG